MAQRTLSAKSEQDATTANLLFAIAHYALRPWPWIIVALASLVVFPDLESLRVAFPKVDPSIVDDDLAYPAMLTRLPSGLLGLVIASLAAAFMSTISTLLNWGSSYLTHDFYRRFFNAKASEKQLVLCGRLATVVLVLLASLLALVMGSALSGFNIILQIGAGTGLIYILRWFWWRVNAYTEIAGMVASFAIALFLELVYPTLGMQPLKDWHKLLIGVGGTTVAWLLATYLTRPTDAATLERFYEKIRPDGPGWWPIQESLAERGVQANGDNSLTSGITTTVAATFLVYSLLFGTGYLLYGQFINAALSLAVAGISLVAILLQWPKLKMQ